MKNQRSHARQHVARALTLVGLIGAIILMVGPSRRASAQATASWSYTGSLNVGRWNHTATLLQDGRVLMAGGYSECCPPTFFAGFLRSAELYDPSTGMWSRTGNLKIPHSRHTATLLLNGKVLIVGGSSNTQGVGNTCELYDPSTGSWSITGSLNTARFGEHTATLLTNGKVLVVGGSGPNTAELYDPSSATWNYTGSPGLRHDINSATLLPNGKVLIAGGATCSDPEGEDCVPNSPELYDPATGTWSAIGGSNFGSGFARLLNTGKILFVGGGAELYDLTTGTWSITGNPNGSYTTATLLANGKVLVAGNADGGGGFELPRNAELYDPSTGTWSITASQNTGRNLPTAVALPNGKALVTGGFNYVSSPPGVLRNTLGSAELYDPGTAQVPIDDTQLFVSQNYRDFLNRDPDADGLAFWTNEVTLCGSDQQCIEAKRINVSAAFFISIEFQQTGYLVYRIYKASYGNPDSAPVPIKLSEFLPDTQKIGQGVIVNQAGWETVLENNKQAFTAEFVQRSRFTSAYPISLTPDQFVDQFFLNAGVTPSASDRAAAINEFGPATTTANLEARARALRRVAESSTLSQQEFNRAFVLMQYFGYLRRNPNDVPDGDFAGYYFWLNKLNHFNGDFIQAEMVKAFISSAEYRRRFEP